MQYEYEWDHNKARSNLRKHGIQFADAVAATKFERQQYEG